MPAATIALNEPLSGRPTLFARGVEIARAAVDYGYGASRETASRCVRATHSSQGV